MITSPSIPDGQAIQLAEMFRLMGDPSRLRIIIACLQAPILRLGFGGTDAAIAVLRLLRAARLLRAERHGKQVFYSPCDEHVRCTITDMVAHVGERADSEEP